MHACAHFEESRVFAKERKPDAHCIFEKEEKVFTYSGVIPNLFAEGKGVVAEGYLKDKNFFLATKILAKHDENYMPPEVKAAIEGK